MALNRHNNDHNNIKLEHKNMAKERTKERQSESEKRRDELKIIPKAKCAGNNNKQFYVIVVLGRKLKHYYHSH